MAEAIAVAVVGWFVVPNIKELMDCARSYIGKKYKLYSGLPDKLEDLAKILERINGRVRPGFVKGTAIRHMWEFLDTIHDAEELLDALQYQILETNRNHNIVGSKELEKMLQRLDRLHQSSRDIQISPPNPKPSSTISELTNDRLFGYKKEYEYLISRLTGDDARVVGIIGHAGMGKTELARWAFNSSRIKNKFGTHCIWVCVYSIFSQTDLLRQICKSFSASSTSGMTDDMRSISSMTDDMLVSKLKIRTRNGRYLLVLDGVCHDESAAAHEQIRTWKTVLAPFMKEERIGTRILITTRAQICLETLGATSWINLTGIEDNELLRLLKKKAFDNEEARINSNQHKALEAYVHKLHGSPLAAENVACKFKGETARQDNTENRSAWNKIESEHYEDPDIFKHHVSSYETLPLHLQRCFAFCSIFPKLWRFERAKLGKMWIALGFVEGPSGQDGKTTEHVARGYFDALVRRSLFQREFQREGDYYVIHVHIHSMLRRLCPSYYMSMDGSHGTKPIIPLTVRHLSVTTGCLGQLKASKNLRTLLVFKDRTAASSSTSPFTRIDKSVLKESKGLRLLDLSDTGICEVPEGIGELKHLRYLGLPNTIKHLGGDVTKLLLLQTLGVVSNNCKLERIDNGTNRLINLRHLDLGMQYIAQIAGIGSLEGLQGSVEFHAKRRNEGHAMKELEKLNSLREELCIMGLERVKTRQEADTAGLRNKKHVKTLGLVWKNRSTEEAKSSAASDLDVLEGLQPHSNIENLRIESYVGTKSPSWLGVNDVNLVKNLRCLRLWNCWKLKSLPLVGRLPNLVLLEMIGLRSITRIDHVFCGSGAFKFLEKMVLKDMAKLVSWDDREDINGCTPILFPRLKEVKIIRCPLLSSLSGLLYCRRSLEYLQVEECRIVKQNFSRSRFRNLKKLEIRRCPRLKFV